MDGGVLRKLRTDGFQFGFLLEPRDGDVAPLPGGDALLQGGVVEIAAAPQHLIQRPLLGRRGTQFLFVRLAHSLLIHRYLFCLIGIELARVEAMRCQFFNRHHHPLVLNKMKHEKRAG